MVPIDPDVIGDIIFGFVPALGLIASLWVAVRWADKEAYRRSNRD
jgi:hypothetical protein